MTWSLILVTKVDEQTVLNRLLSWRLGPVGFGVFLFLVLWLRYKAVTTSLGKVVCKASSSVARRIVAVVGLMAVCTISSLQRSQGCTASSNVIRRMLGSSSSKAASLLVYRLLAKILSWMIWQCCMCGGQLHDCLLGNGEYDSALWWLAAVPLSAAHVVNVLPWHNLALIPLCVVMCCVL